MNTTDEIAAVRALGEQIGYGQMMSLASALWGIKLEEEWQLPPTGAFIATISPFLIKRERQRAIDKQAAMMQRILRLRN